MPCACDKGRARARATDIIHCVYVMLLLVVLLYMAWSLHLSSCAAGCLKSFAFEMCGLDLQVLPSLFNFQHKILCAYTLFKLIPFSACPFSFVQHIEITLICSQTLFHLRTSKFKLETIDAPISSAVLHIFAQ